MATGTRITRYLSRAPDVVFSVYAIVAAFSTYFCVYGFRKPIAAAGFAGVAHLPYLPPIDYKILLIIAQVCGYCLSKFVGIKVVSEMSPGKRALAILTLIAGAETALCLFALTPRPFNALFLFVNGLPLGMAWGLVFGFLEGRRLSEVLGAGLSGSYIVASGFVKTAGRWAMSLGVDETWMPAVTGLLFLLPLVAGVWMLSLMPPPSAADEALRTKRVPMPLAARRRFISLYAPGIVVLTFLYMFLTAFRDFRDNFAWEIWTALGYANTPSVLTAAEIPIAFGALLALAGVMWVRDNQRALAVVHGIMFAGSALIVASTLAFQGGLISPVAWMILVGLGLYVAYVPYGCVLFDRLIAAIGFVGTSGFLIYVTDSFGYLGSVLLLLYKNFGHAKLSFLSFFVGFAYATGGICCIAFVLSWAYFSQSIRHGKRVVTPACEKAA